MNITKALDIHDVASGLVTAIRATKKEITHLNIDLENGDISAEEAKSLIKSEKVELERFEKELIDIYKK